MLRNSAAFDCLHHCVCNMLAGLLAHALTMNSPDQTVLWHHHANHASMQGTKQTAWRSEPRSQQARTLHGSLVICWVCLGPSRLLLKLIRLNIMLIDER